MIPDIWNMLSYLQFYHIPFLVPKTPAPPNSNNNECPILFPELVDFSSHLLVFHLFFFTSTWFFTWFFHQVFPHHLVFHLVFHHKHLVRLQRKMQTDRIGASSHFSLSHKKNLDFEVLRMSMVEKVFLFKDSSIEISQNYHFYGGM